MDIFEQAAACPNADYYDMWTGNTYHIAEYTRAKRFGLPNLGIRVTDQFGNELGYVREREETPSSVESKSLNNNFTKESILNMGSGAKCELLRDFCGEFYDLWKRSKNHHLMLLIPQATSQFLGNREDYIELMSESVNIIIDRCDVLENWCNGHKSSDLSDDEVANVLDAFYIHSVPAGVESLALDIINNCGVDSPW